MAEVYTTKTIVYNFMHSNFGSSISNLESKYPDILNRIDWAQDEIDKYCHRTWRTDTYSDYLTSGEYPQIPDLNFVRVFLPHTDVVSLTKFEVYDGTTYVDWLTNKEEGRDKDYWVDYPRGVLYLNAYIYSYPLYRPDAIKVSYTYGKGATETDRSAVPKDIEMAATYLVISDMLVVDDYTILVPEGGDSMNISSKIEVFKKRAYEILDRHVLPQRILG